MDYDAKGCHRTNGGLWRAHIDVERGIYNKGVIFRLSQKVHYPQLKILCASGALNNLPGSLPSPNCPMQLPGTDAGGGSICALAEGVKFRFMWVLLIPIKPYMTPRL